MSTPFQSHNRVRALRLAKELSQSDLAELVGISRTGLSAVETSRLVPSVATALSLATALGTTVEALFGTASANGQSPFWFATPKQTPVRYWTSEVRNRTVLFPVEATLEMPQKHDGVFSGKKLPLIDQTRARLTLVLATCDPAAGLLAQEYGRQTPFRLIVLRRTSLQAVEMLKDGWAHAAGIHLADTASRRGNAEALRDLGYTLDVELVPVASWEEGVAYSDSITAKTTRQIISPHVRWIGRQLGAGARRCQDEILGSRRPPQHVATDHQGVVAAIRSGFADAGVCVRLVAEDSQLPFLPVCKEDYDLCLPKAERDDPRIVALAQVVRSKEYRTILQELPGYHLRRGSS